MVITSVTAQAASWQITYPRSLVDNSANDDYPLKLLALALQQTGVNYELLASNRYLSQGKVLSKLKDNREINVVWSMTDIQRENDLLPIRIPIYKGLIGWRLLLIREDMAERFKYIQTLENLLKLTPLQGNDWPDTKILQFNGFEVITAENQNVLFDMVLNAQGDFYPRSVIEIWQELNNHLSATKLQVQPTLGIRYPAAFYFFVNKKSRPLANLIRTGLEKAIKNGKFDELFMESHKAFIKKADLQNRQFYSLENTFLPPDTPLDRKELWFQGTSNN
jgi:hypothetical protein